MTEQTIHPGDYLCINGTPCRVRFVSMRDVRLENGLVLSHEQAGQYPHCPVSTEEPRGSFVPKAAQGRLF
ncbi:hypothetical protein JCM16814_28370 [Desulfobaculum senezii]